MRGGFERITVVYNEVVCWTVVTREGICTVQLMIISATRTSTARWNSQMQMLSITWLAIGASIWMPHDIAAGHRKSIHLIVLWPFTSVWPQAASAARQRRGASGCAWWRRCPAVLIHFACSERPARRALFSCDRTPQFCEKFSHCCSYGRSRTVSFSRLFDCLLATEPTPPP
jgi:hypothetical protein